VNLFNKIKHGIVRQIRRKGFGVHSPFAFRTVLDIIAPKRGYTYYRIDDLYDMGFKSRRELRLAKIIFRITARLNPAFIGVCPAGDTRWHAAAAKARSSIKAACTEEKPIPPKTLLFFNNSDGHSRVDDSSLLSSVAVIARGSHTEELKKRVSRFSTGVLFYSPDTILYFPYPATRFVAYEIEL